MAVRGERAVLGQPEQSVRSGPTRAAALTGAISGTVLLAVSFLPWLHYGYSDGGSVNAWTDSSTSFDTVGGAGYTIGAVMAGFVAAVCATALVRGLFVSEMPEPEPWAHGWAGVVLIVGGAFVFVLSFMRLGVVLDSGYDSYLAPGVGMYIGWLAALGLVVGGGLEIRDARRLRAKRRARPFIGVAGAVFTVMSSAGLFVASFFPWWEGGPPERNYYSAWTGPFSVHTSVAVVMGVAVAVAWVALLTNAMRSARAPRAELLVAMSFMTITAGLLVIALIVARDDALQGLPDFPFSYREEGAAWFARLAAWGFIFGAIVELISGTAGIVRETVKSCAKKAPQTW